MGGGNKNNGGDISRQLEALLKKQQKGKGRRDSDDSDDDRSSRRNNKKKNQETKTPRFKNTDGTDTLTPEDQTEHDAVQTLLKESREKKKHVDEDQATQRMAKAFSIVFEAKSNAESSPDDSKIDQILKAIQGLNTRMSAIEEDGFEEEGDGNAAAPKRTRTPSKASTSTASRGKTNNCRTSKK